jgi:hypothetical protein
LTGQLALPALVGFSVVTYTESQPHSANILRPLKVVESALSFDLHVA